MLARLAALLRPSPVRKALSAEFRQELHKQAAVLHFPGGAIAAVAWLGFALDTDRRLHPEFPELFYFRIALTVISVILLLAVLHDRLRGRMILRGRGLGWMYLLNGYVLLATAFFTGRIADDPNYVSGLQIVVMLIVFVPFPRRMTYGMYAASLVLFVGSVSYYRPDLSTFKAQYSMQNLGIAYLLSFVMTFILDRYRFNIFANHKEIVTKSRQVQEQMQQVRTLKEQQDGDYFLTANLIKPLIRNEASSGGTVHVEFLLDQKKKFAFRNWNSEIGGDYLYADTIVLAEDQRFVVFINGDAMGKSVQGAGGALVLGTVFRSLITRTQQNPIDRRKFPERWLKDAFLELQDVFVTFDGTMLISCVLGLVEESTGMLYYINAEHPHPVLFRAGHASFLETSFVQRKIGTQGVESRMRVQTARLQPEDVLILGSDGRDDLLLRLDAGGQRVINEDERLFVQLVERSGGLLGPLTVELQRSGELTDDLSLMRLSFREDSQTPEPTPPAVAEKRSAALALLSATTNASPGSAQAREAAAALDEAVRLCPDDVELAAAGAAFWKRQGEVRRSAELYEQCVRLQPEVNAWILKTASALRRLFRAERRHSFLERAADFGERLRLRDPEHVDNLLQLADTYRLLGLHERSARIAAEAGQLAPGDARIEKLRELLQKHAPTVTT